MSKTVLAVIAVIVIAVAGGAIVLIGSQSDTPKEAASTSGTNSTTSTSGKTDTSTQADATAGDNAAADNTITYSNSGFSPASLTVKAGSKVTVKNTSSSSLQFASDPHPQHTDDPELNTGLISAGESKIITVTTTGSHGYHNHLNSSDTGTLVVK